MPEIKRKRVSREGLFFCEFIAEKEARGLSEQSIENYKKVYNIFTRQIGEDISKTSIYKWIHKMIDSGMNPISINFYISQIRVFVYWLVKNGHCERFDIKKIKTQEPQLKTLSDEEITTLLKKPAINCNFVTYRSWVIINFILATGARASTVMNVMVDDIDFYNKEIRYSHLKNKQTAIVPMSITLEKVLKTYFNTWDLGKGYLFPDKYGGKLTLNALEQSLRKYTKRRGLKYKGAHSLRHTFARAFVMNGGNAFVLQRLLTHTDLEMTKKYVRLFDGDLHKNFDNLCPLDCFAGGQKTIKRK